MLILQNGQDKVVDILIQAGANLTIKNSLGRSPLEETVKVRDRLNCLTLSLPDIFFVSNFALSLEYDRA